MKKLKILHVELTNNYGGIESLLLNILSQINREVYNFDFVATAKAEYQKEFEKYGATIYQLPSTKNILAYIKTFRSILNEKYDIVHFHKNSAANIIPILLAKYHPTHPKIIIHSHNTLPSINNKILLQMHKINRHFLNNLSDKELACASVASDWMFGKKSKAQIINNGINTKHFTFSDTMRNILRQKYKISKNDFVIGNVGRFSEQKNQTFLVDVFEKIVNQDPNSKLMLIGDGPLLGKVKDKVNRYNLEEKVLFLGRKTNVSDYLSAMDVFVMPSLYEGLPIAAIEAQSEGLKVFLSDSISREVVLTDKVKMFSIQDDPSKVAELILREKIIKNRKDQAIMVNASSYSLNNTVKDLTNVYQRIMK